MILLVAHARSITNPVAPVPDGRLSPTSGSAPPTVTRLWSTLTPARGSFPPIVTMTGVSVLHAAVGCKPLDVSSKGSVLTGTAEGRSRRAASSLLRPRPGERGRFAGKECKETFPAARSFDDDSLAAAPAPDHSGRFETPDVIRGAARRGMQDLVELTNGPRLHESSEDPRALDAHERPQRPRRRVTARHIGLSWWRLSARLCWLHPMARFGSSDRPRRSVCY
jgi:hypothetical protein